jgi:hypothetical protein
MFAPDVDLGEQRHGDVAARLVVQVAEQPVSPGRAAARYVLTAEGPPTLQIDQPRLEDALAAWRVAAEASSWAGDGRARVEHSLDLRQTKPGVVPLPGVRLRLRGGPDEGWHEASWPDPLHETRDVAPVVEVGPAPPSPWPGRLQAASALVALALAAWFVVRLLHRRREKPAPALSAAERAAARLAASQDPAAITEAVRDFLAEQAGLPAARMTTDEIMAALSKRAVSPGRLGLIRHLLEMGDLAKFSGWPASPSQAEKARELASEAVRDLATWPVGETGAGGEGG